MPRLAFPKNLLNDYNGVGKSNRIAPSAPADGRSKVNRELPTIDVGPPLLPPLLFGLDDASTSSFDLGDILEGSEKNKSDTIPGSSAQSVREARPGSSLAANASRASVGHISARGGYAPKNFREHLNPADRTRPSSHHAGSSIPARGQVTEVHKKKSIPLSTRSEVEHDTKSPSEAGAEAMIRELRMELAKHDPMSPLLHGTPQQEYGLLLEKRKKLSQELQSLEGKIRDMHIEKEMLRMDLDTMKNELNSEALASDPDKLQAPPAHNPRMSTTHDFMKQVYVAEVKALQEQKERLQGDIQLFALQRESVLNEMQILSVRNSELSSLNNDMQKDMQERKDTISTLSDNSMPQSFAEQSKRRRQSMRGNRRDSKSDHFLGSNASIFSQSSTLSDFTPRKRHSISTALRKERRQSRADDIHREEVVTSKKIDWRKGTANTVKSMGAMFGKLLVDGPGSSPEVPASSNAGQTALSKDQETSNLFNVSANRGSGDEVSPPSQSGHVLFGTGLAEQLKLEQKTVPSVVESCIEAVNQRGLDVEGIYRRSGMAADIRQLVQAYDSGLSPDLMDLDTYHDICSVTSALKQYLRSLPEPLIPYDKYAAFMGATGMPEEESKLKTFRILLEQLPPAHYQTLKVLLEHLNRVAFHDKVNRMNAKNLSVVFGPTLMRNPDANKEMQDTADKNMTIEFLIANTPDLFLYNARVSTPPTPPTTTPAVQK